MTVTAKQLAMAVAFSHSPFSLKGNDAVIENVSHGMFGWGEADIIALTKSGYMVEGEIKISRNDIKADLKKTKWSEDSSWIRDIKDFYYIVPKELVQDAIELTTKSVIEAGINEKGGYYSKIIRVVHSGRGRKLFLEERNKLLRLGCFRAWRN